MKQLFGFSLIELLISLFLVSLISAMLIQAYVLSKQQYLSIERKLERHFDVQWVRDLLADSVRRAGFTPCLNLEQLDIIDRRGEPRYLDGEALKIKRDAIHVNRMSEHFAELIATPHAQQILISANALLHKKLSVLIADCEHAEVHQVIRAEKTSQGLLLTLDGSLFFSYSPEAYVGQWLEESWFIKENRQGKSALFYKQLHSEELTSSIHSLTTKEELIAGKHVVTIALGLDNEQSTSLTVVVRS